MSISDDRPEYIVEIEVGREGPEGTTLWNACLRVGPFAEVEDARTRARRELNWYCHLRGEDSVRALIWRANLELNEVFTGPIVTTSESVDPSPPADASVVASETP